MSYSFYKGYFSSSDSEEEVSSDTSTKSNQSEKTISTRHQNIDSIDEDEDEDRSKIIGKIEGEYNSAIYDHHLNIKQDKKKTPRTSNPNIKIKKEEDHIIEMVLSVRKIQEYQTNDKEQANAFPKLLDKKN